MKQDNIVIRPMTVEDIDKVLELEKDCFATPWSREAFEKEMENRLAYYLVGEKEKQIVAYAGAWKIVNEGHITNIAVHSTNRGEGIGYKLTKHLIKKGIKNGIDSFTLEVRTKNQPAINLYKKIGFEIKGIRKDYYNHPSDDASIMWYDNNKV